MAKDLLPITIQCPYCFGRIDLALDANPRNPHETTLRTGQKASPELSIVCVTQGFERAERFLEHHRTLADSLHAEYVIGYDTRLYDPDNLARVQSYADTTVLVKSKGYVESVINQVLAAAHGRWLLVLDDDEMVSSALWEWLQNREYVDGIIQVWAFPTAAVWPVSWLFITDKHHWPDTHVRLMTWRFAEWHETPHGGHKHVGIVYPAAILHHRYLVKSAEERRKIWQERDAGSEDHAHIQLEAFYAESGVTVAEVGSGFFDDLGAIRDTGTRLYPGPKEAKK